MAKIGRNSSYVYVPQFLRDIRKECTHMKKRFLSTLMALCLALSLLPATALATGALPETVGEDGYITLESGDYVLSDETTLPAPIKVTGNVTLDLAGHTLQPAENYSGKHMIRVSEGGNLTLTDSGKTGKITTNNTNGIRGISNNGTFTMTSGAIEVYSYAIENIVTQKSYDSKQPVICNINGGELSASYAWTVLFMGAGMAGKSTTSNGQTINSIHTGTEGSVRNDLMQVNISGNAKITGDQALTTNASSGVYAGFMLNISGNAEISGGENTQNCGIYLPAVGETNISGGHIVADQAIRIAAGKLNITGGIIDSTAASNKEDLVAGASGGTMGALVIGKAGGGYVGDILVNIGEKATIRNVAEGDDPKAAIVVSDKYMSDTSKGYDDFSIEVNVNGATVDGNVVKVSNVDPGLTSDGGDTTLTLNNAAIEGDVINQTAEGNLEITGGTVTGDVTNSSRGETVISKAEVTGTVSNTDEGGNKGSVAIIDSTVGAVTTGQDIILVNTSVGDNEPTTDVGENVAMVGAKVYRTLEDAIDAANKGDTVRLLNDVTLSASGIVGENGAQALTIDKDLTIDGKGKYTIKGENFAANVRLITVRNNANVTFNEVTLDGGDSKTEPTVQGARHGLNLWNAGKVILNDVRINNCDWYAVANNGSELIVNGLTTTGNAWGINIDNNGTAVINNANISEDSSIVYENGEGNGSLTVNGGTYQNLVVQAEDEEDVCGGTIELKGGSFKGVTTNGKGETNDTEIVSISGGNYDTDVSKYVDSGLTWDPSTGEVAKPVEPDDDDDRPSQGGGSSSSEPSYSPVMDVSKGGSVKVNPRTPGEGDEVTITVDPDAGYEVDEVIVTDRSGREVDVTAGRDGTYTFEQPKGRVTIAVTFVREGTSTFFADVAETYWAYDEIAWAYENGYVNGVTATTFAPGASISRQQIWMILARIAGDDPADMAAARQWSIDNGISDGTNPGSAVTRQQLAALLFRFAGLMGLDTTAGGMAIREFPDYEAVASYAVEAMDWAVSAGIINGTTDGTLNPTGTATRAQFAVMLYRFWTGV